MESAVELIEKLRGGEIRAEELVEICFERIKELNPKINAFVTLNPNAIKEAKEVKGKPLAGLPVAVKDNTDTRGLRTTYGSRLKLLQLRLKWFQLQLRMMEEEV
ncbi:MAG: amidase family protein [Archaeoglobaceae archaeon]